MQIFLMSPAAPPQEFILMTRRILPEDLSIVIVGILAMVHPQVIITIQVILISYQAPIRLYSLLRQAMDVKGLSQKMLS